MPVPTTSSVPMAEQTMVERVARAICKADALAPDANAPIYIGVKAAKAWEARLPMARAAIEAMRDPTDEMFDAWRSVNCETEGERTVFDGDFGQWLSCHIAMLNAALKS